MSSRTVKHLADKLKLLPEKLRGLLSSAAASQADVTSASDRKRTILLLVRAALAVITLLVSSLASVGDVASLLIRILAFLILGYDTLGVGLGLLLSGTYWNRNLLVIFVAIAAFSIGYQVGAVLMMLFFCIWEYVVYLAVRDGKKTVLSALDPRPKAMTVILGGIPHTVDSSRISVGDVLLLPTGSRTAVDCVVLEGEGTTEKFCLVKDLAPVSVSVGDSIEGGAKNLGPALTVRTVRTFDDSFPSVLRKEVENSAAGSAVYEERLRVISRVFTSVSIILAAVIGIFFPLVFDLPFRDNLKCAFLILLLSSPYVLLDTIPFTVFAGIGGAAKNGILIRNAKHLHTLSSVTTVVADSNGALSEGNYAISEVHPFAGDGDTLLSLASAVSNGCEMPLFRVLARHKSSASQEIIRKRTEFPGLGVTASFQGNILVTVGHGALFTELGLDVPVEDHDLILYAAVNDRLIGRISFEVSGSNDAPQFRQHFRNAGISRCILFSGDSRERTRKLAEELGFSEFYAECTPGKKSEKIRDLQAMQLSGERLAYIGDGVGDSSVMKQSDIGISTTGDLHQKGNAASVLLLTGKPKSAADAVILSADVMTRLHRNFYLPLFSKILMIVVACLGWLPFWLPVLVEAMLHFAALLNALQSFDPETFNPGIVKRTSKAARRLWGVSESDRESRRIENAQEAELLRRRRAETKALLFHPRNQ